MNRLKFLSILICTLMIISSCGGGGGSDGGGGEVNLPQVLDFESPDNFINTSFYETSSSAVTLSGGIKSGYSDPLDCDDPGNFTPREVMSIRWANQANDQAGETQVFKRCYETGLILGEGVQTFWQIRSISLEPGDNLIVLRTFEDGRQVGRDSITIIRNDLSSRVSDQVTTAQGTLQGVIENGLSVFRGVRYAAAPVGDLRFKAPEDPPTFQGIADSTEFGSVCVQPSGTGFVGKEDCLFLNIWAHNDEEIRPVIVFLHGGGANGVGGNMQTTEGSSLARNGDAIVVTLNRRIGVMGSLALDELVQENPRATAGNYEVLDVISALSWIQENIAAFNGNPYQVILAGESAGGRLICHILAAPEASGLFQSAAIQSGGCGGRLVLNDQLNFLSTFPPLLTLHRPIIDETNCDTAADLLECLRSIPAAELVEAAQRVPRAEFSTDPFGPVIDGVVVQTSPHTALQNELVGSVSLIVGSNKDEMANISGQVQVADDSEYRNLLALLLPDPLDDQIYVLYHTSNFDSAKTAYLTFLGDLVFNCEAEELARSASGGSAGSYLYLLTRGFDNGALAGQGAVHAIDVPYLFETFSVFGYTPDAQALTISETMQIAWSGLAAQQSVSPPLSTLGTGWPAYDADNIQVVELGDTISIASEHRAGRCNQLRQILSL